MNSLGDPKVRDTLEELHRAAKGDIARFIGFAPRFIMSKILRKDINEIFTAERMKEFFIPVSPDVGRFLYYTGRAITAQRIVEFGTSFGISTIYLAAAVRDNDGIEMIGSELEPSKHTKAVENIRAAGLSDITDVRLGDALETFKQIDGPIDMLLLDGWKDLYLPVLEVLMPHLRPGAVVVADNIHTFKKELRPYVDYMQSGNNGFDSTTLEMGEGIEYSVKL